MSTVRFDPAKAVHAFELDTTADVLARMLDGGATLCPVERYALRQTRDAVTAAGERARRRAGRRTT